MNGCKPTVEEYISALRASEQFGPRIVDHRTLPASRAITAAADFLPPELRQLLKDLGIKTLYSHQAKAIKQVMAEKNILVATPTASGKSLIYNLPVFARLLDDPAAKALYIFPLKALAQDQLAAINTMAELLPNHFAAQGRIASAVYDGDTTPYMRKKIRENLPGILITNPDMLHLSLLPYQDNWAHLFAHLTHVILDEVHTYRGVFGSHMAWVIKRLQRTCRLYGSDPTFLLSSATVGNPRELGRNLIDSEMTVIDASGAPRPARHITLLNPLDSAPATASMLLQAAVHRGLRTIVYTQSRKMAELITMWAERRLSNPAGRIASYRAGFLPEERRNIEQQLADGTLLGVISTSALELGIDIGNLDICILAGYPGSMMATWQRSGRVGRGRQDSLTVLIAHEDALDQYFMRHPDAFFERGVEPVVINPQNPEILKAHLVCMAAEAPLAQDDPSFPVAEYIPFLDELTDTGQLLQSASGNTWFAARKFPQRHVNLRGSGTRYTILDRHRHLLGEIDGFRALKECHAGAVYLHRANSYLIDSLDTATHEILAGKAKVPYYTRVMTSKQTKIMNIAATSRCGCTRVHFGRLRVTETITGYQKILIGSQKVIAKIPLDLPPHIFETEGLWLEIPEWIRQKSEHRLEHFMGGIHALEHAIIGVLPLLVLCDRNDIGGISHPWHDQLEGAAVFIYDGHAGGVGLTRKGFADINQLLEETLQVVKECTCSSGCPSCVHSPKCGSGNRPIDKSSCLHILEWLRKPAKTKGSPGSATHRKIPNNIFTKTLAAPDPKTPLPENYGVFDVETQLSAQEVGGWHRADKMRISVAVLYTSRDDAFESFTEDRIHQLIDRLFELNIVVGFNNKRFDNKVLSAYTRRRLSTLPSLDILEEIANQLGYRLSLDRLAEHTLGVKKSADGLQALKWFKQGQIEKIARYCTKDVQITHDIFLHGLHNRHLLFRNKAGRIVRLPVNFGKTITDLLHQA
ncbi:MAG: DEAD/DEAH box helicase [Desulfobulbus sp.]|nr:MAG: DEAD/DEAH box helicase [Desulfobulbus sp.]